MLYRRVPDWLIQLTWFAAALGATGAFWYFLGQHNDRGAAWSAVGTVVLAVAAVAMHMVNDRAATPSRHSIVHDETLELEQKVTDADADRPDGTLAVEAVNSRSAAQSQRGAPPRPARMDIDEADLAAADANYTAVTMDEYFDGWYNKAKTQLQRDEIERQLLNKRVIWEGVVESVETGRGEQLQLRVTPINNKLFGSTFLTFDSSQRADLLKLHPGQVMRFTGIVRNFVASPFIKECRLLRVLGSP